MKSILSLPKESVRIEYKARFSPTIGSVICGFLNTIGGKLYIGIDERGRIFESANDINRIYDFINSTISPNPSEWIKVDTENWSGANIIIVSVTKPRKGVVFTFRGVVYIRAGEANRRIDANDYVTKGVIARNTKIATGLSIIKDYEPSNSDKRIEFHSLAQKNNVHYQRLGQPSKNTTHFFKYCSLDVALSIFRKTDKSKKGQRNPPQTMRFVEPPSWPDQYERRFYTADYRKVKRAPNSTPKLYATCFTPREESEPAWQIYNRGKEGLGKRCVQFRLNQIALRNELVKNLKDCTIIEGVVDYVSKYFIDELHLSTKEDNSRSDLYEKYFNNFTLDNFINLLLLKRTAYEHEKEVRIFIIYDKDKNGHKAKKNKDSKHKDISLDWLSMLEGIKVDPECTDIEIKLLQDEINRLIDDRKIAQNKKKELKTKLKVDKYDVNKDEENNKELMIGETYAAYKKRRQANIQVKKTAVKKSVAKKTTTKKTAAKKPAKKP